MGELAGPGQKDQRQVLDREQWRCVGRDLGQRRAAASLRGDECLLQAVLVDFRFLGYPLEDGMDKR